MSTARLLIGLTLLLLGISFLFDQFGFGRLFFFDDLLGTYWPLILIAIGVSALNKNNTMAGLILVVLGSLFQISELFDVSAFSLLWPLVIIFAGISILFKDSFPYQFSSTTPDNANRLNDTVTFWGLEKKVNSSNFEGGKISCTFGGIELDLRNAVIASGGADLEVQCYFGGIEIRVSETMRVVSHGDAVLGGWENSFSTSTDESLPVLNIRGNVAFGGVEITN